MADGKTKTGTADDTRINTSESYELQYWSEKFGVTRAELIAAVEAAGPMVADVRRELDK